MRTLYSFFLIVAFILNIQAQEKIKTGAEICSEGKQQRTFPLRMSKAVSPGSPKHTYDALHYSLTLDLYKNYSSPFPKSFNGSVAITLKADSVLSSIALDAVNSSIAIDSVRLAGTSFTHTANILTVQLNKTYQINETLTVQIFYRHKEISDGAFFVGADGMVFTDAEPEGARRWFPCWDKPYDKATMELRATVPSNVKLGSNGLLKDTTRSGDSLTFHWVSKEPVSTYLFVISSKVNYNLDIVYWKKLSNPLDSIPIFFYWNTGENVSALNNIKTKIIPMTTKFSQLFGEHPFQKNGFATLNQQFTWGGMDDGRAGTRAARCAHHLRRRLRRRDDPGRGDMNDTERTYETASARLEAIIRRLDTGEAGLRETLDLVKEGRGLVEYCAGELDAVSRGLEELRLDELVARLDGQTTATTSDEETPS